MKKLFFVLLAAGLALGASAQKGYYGGRGFHSRPRVSIGFGVGVGPFYPFYRPYSPWGSPYGYHSYSRPSTLDLDIQDIRIDYADRIEAVRMDRSLTRRERRQRIRQLKYERDRAINDAKRNYYYNRP